METTAGRIANPYRIVDGKRFRLKQVDPGGTGSFRSKRNAEKLLEAGVAWLAEEQDKRRDRSRPRAGGASSGYAASTIPAASSTPGSRLPEPASA